ncbi:MAG: type II toxin-antitoxin system VapC family toxin [Gaiellaceae bacterium]
MIVLDSSAAVDYLAGLEHGPWIGAILDEEDDVHVPHVLDIEVAGALRTLVSHGSVSTRTASAAIEDLALLDLARHPHVLLLERIWQLRANVSAADASFVALAELLDAPLVTTDLRLARAPGIRAQVVTP